MVAATERVFAKIPGTVHPSSDGQIYLKSGYNIINQGLKNAKWTNVTANDVPGSKNQTYGDTAYMYSYGERGGPLATYLVDAAARSNFHLWLNTSVERVVRTGGHATGLDVVPYHSGGYSGRVNLTPVTGRVIISAGSFGTPKLLFRSKSSLFVLQKDLTQESRWDWSHGSASDCQYQYRCVPDDQLYAVDQFTGRIQFGRSSERM